MKIFVVVVIAIAFLTVGCTKTEVVEKPVVVEKTVVVEKEVPPASLPKNEVYPGANKPSDYVPPEIDPKGHVKENSPAETKHIEKEIDSRAVVEVVPENKTGRETVYLHVHLKNFDDGDILQQVVDRIEETANNNNYKVTREQQPSRKEMHLKLWSELPGPISLEQTLQNSLRDYSLRMEPREDHQFVIMPK